MYAIQGSSSYVDYCSKTLQRIAGKELHSQNGDNQCRAGPLISMGLRLVPDDALDFQ